MVITGEVEERYVTMKIGPVVTSRFTTTQARTLRLWISVDQPSFELTRVVKYLVLVWGQVFLLAKRENSLVLAPRMLLLEVMLTRKFCSYPEKTLLKTSLSTNGQMAHPENVLLAMLASPDTRERKEAVDIVMKIRELGPVVWDSPSGVRPFKVLLIQLCFNHNILFSQREDHEVNLDALTLQTLNIIPLSEARTEPPVTRGLSGPQLLSLKESPLKLNLPGNTVSVERGVKDVTGAASVCADSKERDGVIFQKITSRKKHPLARRNRVYGT